MLRRTCAVALAVLAAAAPAASAHQGSPNYLTQINAVTPAVDGLTVEVLSRDDRLLLRNTSGRDVVVEGYNGEPYARVQGDGTVEVNEDSPAYYLNDDRFGDVAPPAAADGKGAPQLEGAVAHRALRVARPPHALDVASSRRSGCATRTEQTKIFDWSVPAPVERAAGGDRRARCSGRRRWRAARRRAPSSPSPRVLIACCIAVIAVRRRRPPAVAGEAW